MTDSNLKLALNMHTKRVQQQATPEPTEEEQYQAFHFGRVGAKAQFTVGFWRADGFCEGLAYADLRGWTTGDQVKGFELVFTETKVRVEGSNLTRILELIRQHRLTDLFEASREQLLLLPDDAPKITKITCRASRQP